MMNWYLLWKYKHWIVIGVLIASNFWMSAQLNKADTEKAEAIAAAVKPYEDAITRAKNEAMTKERENAQNLIKVEQDAIEKIKAADADADRANAAAVSLSKQLEKAKRNLPTATTETVIEYVEISSDVFQHCVTEYRKMGKAADGERIDKEKLDEGWPQ